MKLTEVIAQYGALRKAMGEHLTVPKVCSNVFRQLEPDIDIEDIHADASRLSWRTGPVTRLLAPEARRAARAVHLCHQPWHRRPRRPCPPRCRAAPRFVPHVYTHDELGRLVRATSSYRQHSRNLSPTRWRRADTASLMVPASA